MSLRLQTPTLAARVSPPIIASTLVKLIASGTVRTKTDLVRATGLSRTTVDTGIAMLLEIGAIRSGGLRDSQGRGRRAELLEIEPAFGAIVCMDFGLRNVRVAIADLGQRIVAECQAPAELSVPEAALDWAIATAERLLEEADLRERNRVTVVGVPGPVDGASGMLVRPPLMPGWDGFPIAQYVKQALGGFVTVANGVNLRALGEARATELAGSLLYVKVGTGIGAGIVTAGGDLLVGADGAAGDIGHLKTIHSQAICSCGRTGCLEAIASVAGMARGMLSADGRDSSDVEQFIRLVRRGDPGCVAALRRASSEIGEVIAALVHFTNPSRILLGGEIAYASDALLEGVRRVVYERALPLGTRNLMIGLAPLGPAGGIAGAIVMGSEMALSAQQLSEVLARRMRATQFATMLRPRALETVA